MNQDDSSMGLQEDSNPLISIIIVLHNSEEALSDSIPALKAELHNLRTNLNPAYISETIFIDNASANNPENLINKLLPQSKLIRLDQNQGFAAGCNAGAKAAQGEFLFFLNPDVILDSNAIENLIDAIKSQPDAYAVTCRMRNPDNSFQPTCRKLPTKANIFNSRGSALSFNSNKLFSTRNNQKAEISYTLPDYTTTTAVPASAATALLLNRETFNQLGGFDERYFMFLEDTDLSKEIQEQGGKIYFCPQAGAVHLWGRGSKASAIKRSSMHHISVSRYYRKRLPGFFSSAILPIALLANFLISSLLRPLRKS